MKSIAGLSFAFWPPQGASPAKRPIVALHGLLGSHKNFAGFASAFSAQGHPVICFDCRNHGESFHDTRFDYFVMAADLESSLAGLAALRYGGIDWQKVILLGHSMGGRTAFVYALLYPQRLAGLIGVDIAPSRHNPDPGILPIVRAMRRTQASLAGISGRKEAEHILLRELGEYYSPSIVSFLLLCNLKRLDSGAYAWRCNLKVIEESLDQIICWPAEQLAGYPAVYLPLLLIVGGRSPYVEPQGWELLLEYFPHCEATLQDQNAAPSIKKVIADSYHWPHTEAPEEFRTLIAEFLDSLS
ncbi:MAG: alpha/beta fold hydrolase [Spirochaetota bacterium]